MEEIIKKDKLVFDPRVARTLVHQGFQVVDLKPYRDNPERTIVVFENTAEFQTAFAETTEAYRVKDEAKRAENAQ